MSDLQKEIEKVLEEEVVNAKIIQQTHLLVQRWMLMDLWRLIWMICLGRRSKRCTQ